MDDMNTRLVPPRYLSPVNTSQNPHQQCKCRLLHQDAPSSRDPVVPSHCRADEPSMYFAAKNSIKPYSVPIGISSRHKIEALGEAGTPYYFISFTGKRDTNRCFLFAIMLVVNCKRRFDSKFNETYVKSRFDRSLLSMT